MTNRRAAPESSALERDIERALQPGRFIGYRECYEFVSTLESILEQLRGMVGTSREAAEVAAGVLATFLGACHEKAEEIDDSGANLSMFVNDLFVCWVQARQTSGASAEETIADLVAWMDDDPYGFCLDLERDVARVMNALHLATFERVARARLRSSAPDDRGRAGYPRRRWTEVLERLLVAQRRVDDFVAMCRERGLSSNDCDVVAGIHAGRGHLEEALRWTRNGLTLCASERYGSAQYELNRRERDLLQRLGRFDEVLEAAWREFDASPGRYGLDELREVVPPEQWERWRERALTRVETAGAPAAIEVFVELGDERRLAKVVAAAPVGDLAQVDDRSLMAAAHALEKERPELSAALYASLAERILEAKQSKRYATAHACLERARAGYAAAGEPGTWEQLVASIRAVHARKYSFMPGFEAIVAGGSASDVEGSEDGTAESFLERSRRRWSR